MELLCLLLDQSPPPSLRMSFTYGPFSVDRAGRAAPTLRRDPGAPLAAAVPRAVAAPLPPAAVRGATSG